MSIARRSLGTVVAVVLLVGLLPAIAYATTDVVLRFDTAPAVVGQSASTIYPVAVLNPDPSTENLSYACPPLVEPETFAPSQPNAVVPWCPGGEFASAGGLFTRLTSGSTGAVSVRFGRWGLPQDSTPFVLEGFDSGNQPVASATATAAVGVATISTPTPVITSFRVRPTGPGVGYRMWVDDITWTPTSVPLPPDFTVTRPPGGVYSILAGTTGPAQALTVTPVNGSAGNVTWSTSGLPSGVTANVTPTPTGASLSFSASSSLATSGVPDTTVTVTATPVDASTGPAPRSVTYVVAVNPSFGVGLTQQLTSVTTPLCQPVGLQVNAAGGQAVLSVSDPGIPGVAVSVWRRKGTYTDGGKAVNVEGGYATGWTYSLDVRTDATLTSTPPTGLKTGVTLRLQWLNGSVSTVVPLTIHRPAFTLSASLLSVPRRITTPYDGVEGLAGSQLAVSTKNGVALCAGTTVAVGAQDAPVTPPMNPSLTTLFTGATRTSTSGPVVVSHPSFGTLSAGEVTVQAFRSMHGFAFKNYKPGFDFGDALSAFGSDVFIKIPLFPGIEIPTPIPSPDTAVVLAVANNIFPGACYGISRTALLLKTNPQRLQDFSPPGARFAIDLAGPNGPSDALRHRIAAFQISQLSPQFLNSYLKRKAATEAMTPGQLRDAIHTARTGGQYPYLMLQDGTDGSRAHVVVVYDVREGAAPGGWDVDVYDSNEPFTGAELPSAGPGAAAAHAAALGRSTVSIAPDGSWSLTATGIANTGAKGRVRGMALMTYPDIPTSTSMLKASQLLLSPNQLIAVFGTAGSGTGVPPARITQVTAGGRRLLDGDGSQAVGGAALAGAPLPISGGGGPQGWVVRAGRGAVDVAVTGRAGGTYRQTVLGSGLAASVTVPAGAGPIGTMRYAPASGGVAFTAGPKAKAVTIEASVGDGRGGLRTATLSVAAAARGVEAVSVARNGDVVVRHVGGPAVGRLTLAASSVGSSSTATAVVRLDRGTTVLRPASWARLGGALAVTGPRGRAAVALRAAASPVLAARSVVVTTVKGARVATARFAAARIARGDRLTVMWTAFRSGRVVARATGVLPARNGVAVLRWTLPRAAAGARVVAVPVLLRARGVAAATVVGTPAASR